MSMDGHAYSTILDAILFLAMVSVCAIILNSSISSAERGRAESDMGMRKLASSTLAAMESAKVDYFQYRILGDRADGIAEAIGIDPESKLYKDTANAVLGRGNRHKTVMELAAEDVACQFKLRYDNSTLKLNQLTGDYDGQASKLIDGFVRDRVDERYAYQFSLRWAPFANVPLEGSLMSGVSPPDGAASASTYVTLPYVTQVNKMTIEGSVEQELTDMDNATADFLMDGDEDAFKKKIRDSLRICLHDTSNIMVEEVWNNTLGHAIKDSDVHNPLKLLGSFSEEDESSPLSTIMVNQSWDVEEAVCDMIVLYNEDELERLADRIIQGVSDGSMSPEEERDLILSWLESRYNPSRARATISVWVNGHA